MKKPFWVLENIDSPTRKHLFTFWNVKWLATGYASLSILSFGMVGVLVAALLGELFLDPGSRYRALVYGLLFYSTNLVHTLGHIISGHLVGHPMQANLLTATFDVNLYIGDQSGFARKIHLGRALGGPLLNLVFGATGLAVWQWLGWDWLMIWGYMHLASGFLTLIPIDPMDGWVIWQHSRASHRPEHQKQ